MDDLKIKQTLTSLYDAVAPSYERAVVPVYRPIAKRMLQLIDLRPGWQALDAGTGTGLVALMGAPRVGKTGKMIGIDGSEQMLEIARRKAAQYGFTQCEFRVGDLEALDLPDDQLNAVLSQFALHHTAPPKSLHEFHRVLMPGGILVVQEWADALNHPNKIMFDVLSRYCAANPSDLLALARVQSERGHAFRTSAQSLETMTELVQAAGFSNVEARHETYAAKVASVDAVVDLVTASPTVQAEMSALSDDAQAAFLKEAREALVVFETPAGFSWTYKVLVLVAHKH